MELPHYTIHLHRVVSKHKESFTLLPVKTCNLENSIKDYTATIMFIIIVVEMGGTCSMNISMKTEV